MRLLDLEPGVGLLAVGHMTSATVPADGFGVGGSLIEIARRGVAPHHFEPTLSAFREGHGIGSAVCLPVAGDLFKSVGELRGVRRGSSAVLGRDILLQAAIGWRLRFSSSFDSRCRFARAEGQRLVQQ